MSIPLLAARLNHINVPATPINSRDFLVTDDHHQHGNPDFTVTRQNAQKLILPLLKKGTVPVITGFLGRTPAGATTTLGRGGSDYSASVVGNVLDARKVLIWTDVTGVMSTDPRIDSSARTIPKLMYKEVAELAYFGAKVLHPKCIRPAVENGGELWVKNTFEPAADGTQIVQEYSGVTGAIRAVTKILDLSLITIEGGGMLGIHGVAARAFAATARSKANVLMISQASSEQSICFLIPGNVAEKTKIELDSEFAEELKQRDIDSISNTKDMVIVTAVGTGMRETPGVAGKIFTALGEQKINVIAIAQGSSECSISLTVSRTDAKAAVRCIHKLTS